MEMVIINEIAWMGTEASANDEWIELYNKTNKIIVLDGWRIESTDGTPLIKLKGEIKPYGFFILERTNDDTLVSIVANQIYVGALNNTGEYIKLIDAEDNIVDVLDCSKKWFTGDNKTKQTMEKVFGSENWQTSKEPNGSPNKKNSSGAIIEKPVAIKKTEKQTEQEKNTSQSIEKNQGLIGEHQELLAGHYYNVSESPIKNAGFNGQDFFKIFLINLIIN